MSLISDVSECAFVYAWPGETIELRSQVPQARRVALFTYKLTR